MSKPPVRRQLRRTLMLIVGLLILVHLGIHASTVNWVPETASTPDRGIHSQLQQLAVAHYTYHVDHQESPDSLTTLLDYIDSDHGSFVSKYLTQNPHDRSTRITIEYYPQAFGTNQPLFYTFEPNNRIHYTIDGKGGQSKASKQRSEVFRKPGTPPEPLP